jgi:hypothetical protein
MASIYTGLLGASATFFVVQETNRTITEAFRHYRSLAAQLARIGFISQGSVQDRTHRLGGGAGYQWTRKVAGKTVTVALTSE